MMRKKVIMKKIDGQKTRERRPQIIAKRHQLLEKLAKETIQDMEKAGIKIKNKNIMFGIGGGRLIQEDKYFELRAAQHMPYFSKKKRFSEISMSVPVWEQILSKKNMREKYWPVLKSLVAHEIFHSTKQKRKRFAKKGQKLLTKISKIQQELSELPGITLEKTGVGKHKLVFDKSLFKLMSGKDNKTFQNKMEELKSVATKIEKRGESRLTRSSKEREEKIVQRATKKLYGKEIEKQSVEMLSYIRKKYQKLQEKGQLEIKPIEGKKKIYKEMARAQAGIATIEAARVFRTKGRTLTKLKSALIKKDGIIDNLIMVEKSKLEEPNANLKKINGNILGLRDLSKSKILRDKFVNAWYEGIFPMEMRFTEGLYKAAKTVKPKKESMIPKEEKWGKRKRYGLSLAGFVAAPLLSSSILFAISGLPLGMGFGKTRPSMKKKKQLTVRLKELKSELHKSTVIGRRNPIKEVSEA